MRAGVWLAVVAAIIVRSGAAWAACQPGQTRNCVDLTLAPQASQDIIAGEHPAAPAKKPPVLEPPPGYSGPTVGLNPKLRQAPEIGYTWKID